MVISKIALLWVAMLKVTYGTLPDGKGITSTTSKIGTAVGFLQQGGLSTRRYPDIRRSRLFFTRATTAGGTLFAEIFSEK